MVPSEKSPVPMNDPGSLDLKNPFLAAVLAWMVPGLGHLYQGRISKGVTFLVVILSVFLFGYAQSNWKVVYYRWDAHEWRYAYFGQLGAGLVSLPAMIGSPSMRAGLPEPIATFQGRPPTIAELEAISAREGVPIPERNPWKPTGEFERQEVMVDRLRDRGLSFVTDRDIDDLHRTLGKRMDLALAYTVVAGLLNLLVVFDAFEGPANIEEERALLARAGRAKEDDAT